MRRWLYRFAALIILALVALWLIARPERAAISGSFEAVDGDSLRGPEGAAIRLFGIDAPELHQKCLDAAAALYPCGRDAHRHLKQLLASGPVSCRALDRDRYHRTVARCFAGKVELNRQMVEDGWATAYGRYSLDYLQVEERARRDKRGLWAGVFDQPKRWRDAE